MADPTRLSDERVVEFAVTYFGAITATKDEVRNMADELRERRAAEAGKVLVGLRGETPEAPCPE